MERRIIIAGSRNFNDYDLLKNQVLKYVDVESDNITIVSGTAQGADRLGERFASEFNLQVKRMPANWKLYGKPAGYLRNEDMASYASKCNGMLVAFWDGKSRGTMHMINIAKRCKLEVHVIRFNESMGEQNEINN